MATLQKINSGKHPSQRRGDEPTASTKNSGAKKSEQKEFKPANAPYTHKKDTPPEGMPLITIHRRHQSRYYFVLPTYGPIEN